MVRSVPRRVAAVAAISLVALLAACNLTAEPAELTAASRPLPAAPVATPGPELHEMLEQNVGRWLAGVQLAETKAYLEAVHAANVAKKAAERRRAAAAAKSARYVAQAATPAEAPAAAGTYLPVSYDHACGGDLPPCSVLRNESGGDIRIWNRHCYAPVGYAGRRSPCGGSTASGKWQFVRSTWAGYGGYLNAADAPADVQNAKARELWAGGAGCSHWGAC